MAKFMDRYFKRKTLHLQCRTVTPMFLGNADQNAEWRAEPFKALLRYWWRVTRGSVRTPQELLKEESNLFGFAGESEGTDNGKSPVTVNIGGEALPENTRLRHNAGKINHPEMDPGRQEIDPLLYLAGIGLMKTNLEVRHTYFPADIMFTWRCGFPREIEGHMVVTQALIQSFGAIGARCRNGWGSFQVEEGRLDPDTVLQALESHTENWESGFEKDYPNCIGRDGKGPLLWKTKPTDSWQAALRELADAYVGVRARDLGQGLPRLDPDNGERHLLGVPLTHHNPRSPDRYASPLRFFVRQVRVNYVGFVLHLPHRFSGTTMLSPQDQIETWGLVHRKLDHPSLRLRRAAYQECL